ncbi:MAG TPA: FAD-binding protein [Miltoncostaeaceae bacterium]|nr:FAD-binding protein [Miltoncostaeaceae bacterium]
MTEALSPATPQEAAAALAEASEARASVGVVGGGTRSRRGRPAPPPDRLLRTGGMRRVVAHEPADLTVTVESGLAATVLAELAASAGQAWPQADIREGSTVGGVLAAAASGRRRLRMGAVRDSLLEVVIATGDGRLATGGGRTVKGVAGYDLPRLAVGSLGTLGVIVQVTLKLWPVPAASGWFGAEAPLADRLGVAARALAGPARPASVLLAPGAVAVELIGPEEDVRPPEGLEALPGAPPEPAGRGLLEAGVPPPRLGELAARLEEGGLVYEARMGVGTCLVAVETADDVARARAVALGLGGHAQVVDGPDDLRADPWGPAPPGLELMRRLRDAFDPAGILNRDKLLWEVS